MMKVVAAVVLTLFVAASATAIGGRPTPYQAVKVVAPGYRTTPSTLFIFPTSWRATKLSKGRLTTVASRRGTRCRITTALRQTVETGPATEPLLHARELLPISPPAKLIEEATRAQTDHPGGRSSASRMSYHYPAQEARGVIVSRLGRPRDGQQRWLITRATSHTNRRCSAAGDTGFVLIDHQNAFSTLLAGARTRLRG